MQAAVDAGLAVDDVAPRLSFFFACHMHFFEEIAKFRAARRMWAAIMRDRFGAKDPRSLTLRFHTQTGGATLTAQQPENNIVRTALEAMAAVLGGTQSLHTNSFDEALALPTEQAVKIALRTQQVLGFETGVAETVDPLGGSYYVEALTDELERIATEIIEKIDAMGGAVAAIEAGYYQDEIHEAAFRIQRGIETGERIVVGVNRFVDADAKAVRAPADLRRKRPPGRWSDSASSAPRGISRPSTPRSPEVEETARGTGNLLPPMREALRLRATLGEVSDALRRVFGEYRPPY